MHGYNHTKILQKTGYVDYEMIKNELGWNPERIKTATVSLYIYIYMYKN